ncbi:MAG: nuclear transport factor 2 family protein [Acidimicrobiales bacterium]
MTTGALAAVAERYLETMVAHDFAAMAQCLAEDVVRVGPYGDTYTPREPYVAMLSRLMPSLPGYSMTVGRVVEIPDAGVVVVELTEVVEVDGRPLVTPEALVFDMNDDERIARITIYIQTLPGPATA